MGSQSAGGPRPRLSQEYINEIVNTARQGDTESLQILQRMRDLLQEQGDILDPPEALAIAVQEIRTDERVTDQESSLRSTSDP